MTMTPNSAVTPSGTLPYLDNVYRPVTKPYEDQRLTLRLCRCNSPLCPRCFQAYRAEWLSRCLPVMRSFGDVVHITLTVDPKLFTGPAAAFEHLRAHRSVPRAMQAIRRHGKPHSGRYAYAYHFGQEGYPHVHVITDATQVPCSAVQEEWDRSGKFPLSGAPGVTALGRIHVSLRDPRQGVVEAVERLANYITRQPEVPYPSWLFNYGGRAGRFTLFGVSRPFMPHQAHVSRPSSSAAGTRSPAPGRTHGERVAACGTEADLLETVEEVDTTTGEVHSKRRWVRRVDVDGGEPSLVAHAGSQAA